MHETIGWNFDHKDLTGRSCQDRIEDRVEPVRHLFVIGPQIARSGRRTSAGICKQFSDIQRLFGFLSVAGIRQRLAQVTDNQLYLSSAIPLIIIV